MQPFANNEVFGKFIVRQRLDFRRRNQFQAECMHGTGEFLGQKRVHAALAIQPRHALEGGGDNAHVEVALPARPGALVARVPVTLIDHLDAFGRQPVMKFARNPRRDRTHRGVNP